MRPATVPQCLEWRDAPTPTSQVAEKLLECCHPALFTYLNYANYHASENHSQHACQACSDLPTTKGSPPASLPVASQSRSSCDRHRPADRDRPRVDSQLHYHITGSTQRQPTLGSTHSQPHTASHNIVPQLAANGRLPQIIPNLSENQLMHAANACWLQIQSIVI